MDFRIFKIRPHAILVLEFTLLLASCHCDNKDTRSVFSSNLREPVFESGFKPIESNQEKDGVKKRGLVIDEKITLDQSMRDENVKKIEAEILDSSASESKQADRVSKDLHVVFPPPRFSSQRRDFAASRCDNCNNFPWIPIARAIRLPPTTNIDTPNNYQPQPQPPPPNIYETKPPHNNGDSIPSASAQQNLAPSEPGLEPLPQQIRIPSGFGNIQPNSEYQHNRNLPIPSNPGPSQNYLTYPNSGGSNFKKEPSTQITFLQRPERPAPGMLESILNFFSPRKNLPRPPPPPQPQPGRQPMKNIPQQVIPIGFKHPGPVGEQSPSGTAQLEYEKPPPFPNPPYIPLNEFKQGVPPSMRLPPNKIFIYNIAADQNAKANQDSLPIATYNSGERKPEVNTIRPVQHFANFRYAPMAIFPQPIIGHLMPPCHNCNLPTSGRVNRPQNYISGPFPGPLRLPANIGNIETIKSMPVAQYLASVEYPHEVVQSPLIDVPVKYDYLPPNGTQGSLIPSLHEPKFGETLDLSNKDYHNQLNSPRPVYVPEEVDNSLSAVQTATQPISVHPVSAPGGNYVSSTTAYPDLNSSAGNIIHNLTGSPFRTTTDGYTGLDVVHSQSYADFDWPVTQTTTISSNEETTITGDFPTTLPGDLETISQINSKPSQMFNVSYNEEGRDNSQERPSDPAFNFLSPPPPSADWSQDLWASQPTGPPLPVGALTPNGFHTTVTPAPLKKKKQIQIIVPYTMVSHQDIGKPTGMSTENLITAINQLPEMNKATTLADRPFVTLDHLQQLLDENRMKQENGVDLFRLQKNIDNWTAQGFSNHKQGKSDSLGQEDHIAQIHPAKNIPEDFLTGSEAFSNSFVSSWSNQHDNEKRHIYSSRVSSYENHHGVDRMSVDENRARSNKMASEDTSQRTTSSTEKTDTSKIWDSIPVSISPLTKEKVYMVTAVPIGDDIAHSHGKTTAQNS